VLAKYAQKFGADENRWWFLTGERQALYDLSIKDSNLRLKTPAGRGQSRLHTVHVSPWSIAGNDPWLLRGTEDEELKTSFG